MRQKSTTHVVDFLFTIGLFGVLAVSVLMVVLLGADVYQKVTADMASNFNSRTSLSYVAEKVRQNDSVNGISCGKTANGTDALILKQAIGAQTYATWIFAADGSLREVLVQDGATVKDTDGQPIMELSGFFAEMTDGLLVVTTIDNEGEQRELVLSPRCAAPKI